MQWLGPGNHSPGDLQEAVLVGVDTPANQGNGAVDDLQRGDVGGVQTTPRVEVGHFVVLGELLAMRVAADQGDAVLLDPLHVVALHLVAFVRIACRAGGAVGAERVQVSPEVAKRQPAHLPSLIVGEIALVTVDDQYLLTSDPMLEHHGLDRLEPGQERLDLIGVRIGCRPQVGPHVAGVLQVDVVIAVHPDQPAVVVEGTNQVPDGPVRLDDVLVLVLPQLVAVAGFDVGEPLLPVVLQRGEIHVLVLEELV